MPEPTKKPLNHPDYLIPGINAFSLSKWSRENEPKDPPRFQVGDEVYYLHSAEVVEVYEDCDGSALFALSDDTRGHPNHCLEKIGECPISVGFPEELQIGDLFEEIRRLRGTPAEEPLRSLETRLRQALAGPELAHELLGRALGDLEALKRSMNLSEEKETP